MKTMMITTRGMLFSFVGGSIVCLVLTAVGQAAPVVFVSTTGNDTNLCGQANPCRSFSHALPLVDPGGEIVVLSSGQYSAGFTITKSVTIDATGVNASLVSSGSGDACMISAATTDRVVLRGISFLGANVGGNAITVTQATNLYVDHCSVSEFGGSGVSMVTGGNLWVTGTDVRRCHQGLLVDSIGAAAKLVARDSSFSEMFGGYGVEVWASSLSTAATTAWLSNCTASSCYGGFSVAAFAANADLTLINCGAFGNEVLGVFATTVSGNATVRLANCVVTQNPTGIYVSQQGTGVPSVLGTSPGSNVISGNGSGNTTTGSVPSQ